MSQSASASPLIRAARLTRTYPTNGSIVTGLDAVDLEIAAGEQVVLKGASGSGKSTLLSLLAGLDRPTDGSLMVAGCDLAAATPAALTRFRREIVGMVFQSFNLLPTLTVLENVSLPALLAGKELSETERNATELLNWLKLEKRLTHRPGQLSGGEMQRTAIARALINSPEIILADEPTGNLDSKNGRIVMDLLTELNRKLGRTVIIATHSSQADTAGTLHIRLQDGKIV